MLNELIRKKKPEIILQCGDFGFWPGHRFYDPAKKLIPGKTQIHWIDGNHEDHRSIRTGLKTGTLPVAENMPNVVYQPRGSTLTLPDGRKILFAGGAFSVDNKIRLPGKDWFPDLETLTEQDWNNFPDAHEGQVDIIISHTAPTEFAVKGVPLNEWPDWWDRDSDPSSEILSKALARYKPQQWYFGHFHKFQRGTYQGCNWIGLDSAQPGKKWWIELT